LPEADSLFTKPNALLASKAEWQEIDLCDSELAAAMECILELHG
jgi:hypothetical protein